MLMKTLKLVFRLLIGAVFTLSGFVKAVDPHGSEYIFTDYFVDAFGIPSLESISLVLAIIQSAFEFLVGVCLLANIKPRLSWLGAMIFMIIFTPLTLYSAIYNPVKDCGCFGEAIKLSNWETFFKNIVMLPITVFFFISTKGENNTYKGKIDWILSAGIFLVIVLFQLIGLQHEPIIDFRPYKVGTYIPDKMIIPAGEKPDSFAVFYKMKHTGNGKQMEVSDAEYLEKEIWKDTLWQITETSDPKLIKQGYTPPVFNFKAYPIDFNNMGEQSQQDVMGSILSEENYSFLVISYDLHKAHNLGFIEMSKLLNYAGIKNINVHFLTSTSSDLRLFLKYINFNAKFYNCDPIALKTVIRSNPGLVLLKKGKIIGKWHYNDVPSIKEFETIMNKN
jgi:uncharacterized membrane protein YphA (DoxX/SURF4 family)